MILLKNPSGKKATVKKTTSDVSPGHSNRLQTKLARKNYRHFSYIFAHLQEWGVLKQNRECHIFAGCSSLPSRAALKEQTWKGVTLGMVRSAGRTAQTKVWAVMQAAIDEQTIVLWWPLNPSIRR
jgi:hypothetical protein